MEYKLIYIGIGLILRLEYFYYTYIRVVSNRGDSKHNRRLGCIPNTMYSNCFLTIDQFTWGVTAFGHLSSNFNRCTCMYFDIIDQLQCHENIKNNNVICLKMLVHVVWILFWIPIKDLRIWLTRSVWKNCLKTRNISDFTKLSTKTGTNSYKSF